MKAFSIFHREATGHTLACNDVISSGVNTTCSNNLYLAVISMTLFFFCIPILFPTVLFNQPTSDSAIIVTLLQQQSFQTSDVIIQNDEPEPPNKSSSLHYQKQLQTSNGTQAIVEKRENQLVLYGGPSGFVRFSGFRASPRELVVLGFGDSRETGKRRFGDCRWTEPSGSFINGRIDVMYDADIHDFVLQGMKIRCRLEREALPKIGGKLTFSVNGMQVEGYEEGENEILETIPSPPFRHKVTHCSGALRGKLHADMVELWLKHHYLDYFDHFVFYNAGAISEAVMKVLQPLVDRGIMEIIYVGEIARFRVWSYAQTMFMNDCLYRNRYSSNWIAYLDMDEYLWVNRATTFHNILMENERNAFISHGSYSWNLSICQPPIPGGSIVERIAYRPHNPACLDNTFPPHLCLSFMGHRKLVVNPRLVNFPNIHIVEPLDNEVPGVDLSTDVMMHHHFRGLPSRPTSSICQININSPSEAFPDVLDLCMSERFRELRNRRLIN